ncbi:transforming growth factor-beta-induced protein [Entomortierella parvispora]|uniref:Transforming growth factor-beta-induced protein n=1 Tax=Entomortierella parvispora TaxID=205924 RepID=A0A9P3LXS1_9FUNG|nr:transforming growth factor-beta-induced protein [Entomortierella parvispora]
MLTLVATILVTFSSLAPSVDATKTVIDVVSSDPGFSRLIKELQKHRLIPDLNNREACTFFAPTNDAFLQWDKEHRSVDKDMLLYHILPERMPSDSFKNAMLLETALVKDGYLGDNQEGQRVAVSKPGWIPGRRNKILVGNAELLKVDWAADNGVVHVVSRLMVPPVDLVDTMLAHADLKELYNIIHAAGLDTLLRRHRTFTLFAPSSNALEKLSQVQRQYLSHPQGHDDLRITIQHHIHKGALYQEDVQQGSSSISTLEGQELATSLEDGHWMVDNSEIRQSDVLASNGVIHVVSRPLLPTSLVWTPAKYLIGLNSTQFVERLRQVGLNHYIDDPEASYTIFAPRDSESDLMLEDADADTLLYHIVPGRKQVYNFQDGQLLETELVTEELNGRAQRSKVSIRQDHRSSVVTINGAEIEGAPVQVGRSLIYTVARPLTLPLSLMNALKQQDVLSGFTQALKIAGLSRRISDARSVTVFAPSNAAWQDLGVVNNFLRSDHNGSLKALEAVVRYTIVDAQYDHVLYTADMASGRSVVKTSLGDDIVIDKKGDAIYVKAAQEQAGQVSGQLTGKDLLVESGVVHTVSAVSLPPSLSITLYNVLQGANTTNFLRSIQTSNLGRLLTDWDQDFTIFAPTDQAFEEANLQGSLNDADFMSRLVRLHVVPGKLMELNKDNDEEEPSLLNRDALLSLRRHRIRQTFGVRVKGAAFNKEATIVNHGRAHPAWRDDGEYEDRQAQPVRGQGASWRQAPLAMMVDDNKQFSGVVYVIDRVLLPGDSDPLHNAWFWICLVLLALLGTIGICALTVLSMHALVQELRQIEGYIPVPTTNRELLEEEASVQTPSPETNLNNNTEEAPGAHAPEEGESAQAHTNE